VAARPHIATTRKIVGCGRRRDGMQRVRDRVKNREDVFMMKAGRVFVCGFMRVVSAG